MAKTVQGAFTQFTENYVDLESGVVERARSSRDWLIDQIKRFPGSVDGFPRLHPEVDRQMGSFSRKTKIRPLDDIDFLIIFHAEGTTYNTLSDGKIESIVPEGAKNLRAFCDGDRLNSIKLLNKLKASLSGVSQYSSANIHRNQEAVTLKLTSYTWNFDIVAAFKTNEESDGRSYYLIPDGKGNWKKTDPRIDKDRTTRVNQNTGGKLLSVIRLIKYWNTHRALAPTIGSYLLENLILDYFESYSTITSTQSALRDFFNYLNSAIFSICYDPKGIQGNLNNLDLDTQSKVAQAAKNMVTYADTAIYYEQQGEHKQAIDQWRMVFGANSQHTLRNGETKC